MINPQMLGMGQLPDLPTQAELWKDEKSKYRPFIIMFGVGILIVFALLLASFILNVTNSDIKGDVADWLFNNMRKNYDSVDAVAIGQIASDTDQWYTLYILTYPIISFVLLGIGVLLYGATVYDSYKSKTFAKLSGYTTAIVLIGAMFAGFQLMQMAWSETARIETQFGGGIFQIVAYVLVIVVAVLGSQVTKIKRIFAASARIEQLKNDPNFQAYQQQMQQMMGGQAPMGPFGPVVQPPVENTPGTQQAPVGVAAAQQPKVSDEQAKLEAMTLANLKKVAKKLSISGSDKMDKKELIEAILRVSADEQ